ncbi:MAG: hypothetical protein VR78_04340 [Hoeflea sp. BRH_c9]|nr:MAG: hypothetical protein VR78_04340 [Hoeflea sp. BRH_c9]
MQAALIIMTILGCDDTATQCHHIEMLDERWATIQACDAVSEDKLATFSNLNYPVVVAVCQTPGDAGLAEVKNEPATASTTVVAETGPAAGPLTPSADIAAPVAPQARFAPGAMTPKADIPAPVATVPQDQTADAAAPSDPGLAGRLLQRFKDVLPEAGSVKALVSEPVHVVTDSYSWVARRFEK